MAAHAAVLLVTHFFQSVVLTITSNFLAGLADSEQETSHSNMTELLLSSKALIYLQLDLGPDTLSDGNFTSCTISLR